MHPTGPYWGGVTGTPTERLAHGLTAFRQEYGDKASPDVVVVASNLWDLQRIGSMSQDKFVGHSIEAHELLNYKLDLTSVLTQVEVRLRSPCYILLSRLNGHLMICCAAKDSFAHTPPEVGLRKYQVKV